MSIRELGVVFMRVEAWDMAGKGRDQAGYIVKKKALKGRLVVRIYHSERESRDYYKQYLVCGGNCRNEDIRTK